MTEGRRSVRRGRGSFLVETEDREEHPETVPEAARPFPSRRQSGPEKINMIGRLAAWPRVYLTRRAANSAEGAPRAYSPRRISIDARRTRVSRRHDERFIYTSGGRTQAPRPTTLLRLSAVPRFRRSRSSSGERRWRRQGRPRRGNAVALRRPVSKESDVIELDKRIYVRMYRLERKIERQCVHT